MTSSVAEEANTSSAGNNRACSNRKSRKSEYGNSEGIGTRGGGSSQKRPLFHGGG